MCHQLSKTMVLIFCAFSTFAAHADSFKCSTNYAGFIPSGKFRISGTRSNDSLLMVNAQYFDFQSYRALPLVVDSENNPDRNYKPHNYKNYMRYLIDGKTSGESYEFFLPSEIKGPFMAYIIATNFEDKSPRYELLCRDNNP